MRDGAGPTYTHGRAAALCGLFVLLLGCLGAGVAERQVLLRLTAEQGSGSYEERAHLTFGVPLARGAVTDAGVLRLWRGDDDAALPIQARPLSRWPDGSVRWALVDTQVALQAHESLPLALGLAPDIPADEDPFTVLIGVSVWDDTYGSGGTVSDGTTSWPLLVEGPRGDEVLGLSAEIVDRFGMRWRADVDDRDDWSHQGPGEALATCSVDAGEWEIVERGPLRLTARLRGAHRPEPGQDIPEDAPPEGERPAEFHTFTVYVHLLAGTSTARVEWTLENGPLHDPTGPLAFRSYSLSVDPCAVPGDSAPAGDDDATHATHESHEGHHPEVDLPGSPERGDYAFELRQEDAGAPVLTVNDKKVGRARHGDQFAGIRCGEQGGVYLHRVASGPNHPTTLTHEPGGPLVMGLLADVGGHDHWLDDATRKTFRLTVARDAGGAGRALMLAARRPSHVTLDPADVAASGAWGDLGLMDLPTRGELGPVAAGIRAADAPTGWADHGEWVKNTHQSGSPRNRLSVFLEAIQSGRRDLFEASRARAWHAMDLRPYHLLGFSADEFPDANLYEGLPHGNEPPENRLGRTGLEREYFAYKDGLPSRGHVYNGFDPEHMTLDDVYECYLLTGSWPALSALRSAGEAMLTWQWVTKWLHTARSTGWTLRALVQMHRATGDDRYLDAARHMVDMLEAERGRGEVPFVHRNKADPRHLADEESESPWMVAVAIHGLAAYGQRSGDPRIPGILEDLVQLLLLGYRGNGFVSDLPVDRRVSLEQLRAEWDRVWQPTGTSQWVPGALGAAAVLTGDHTPVDRVYPYYVQMTGHASSPARFGASSWHWWQPYLVSLRSRYGDRAVASPREFEMPVKPLTPEMLAP